MRTRGLVIAVAALLAVLATAAVFLYVRGVEKENGGASTVSVIVAKEDIPVGARLDEVIQSGGVTARNFPKDTVARGAVTDVGQLRGRIANAPILAGEQISTARLEGSSTQPQGGALGIPEGHQAVTFAFDMPSAGGGIVQKGDHVTVYASFSDASVLRGSALEAFLKGRAPANNTEQKLGDFVITVVPDAQVLKVVQGAITSSSSESRVLMTLALRPQDATGVILAQQNGVVWLALLPPNQQGEDVPPTSLFEVITGELTPQ
ncbi:MAG: Flp pilus assembly protein CpaB [Actinomycetota bacterium]